jgi:hypothetical protein
MKLDKSTSIDKMVSQAEDNLTSSQLSRLKELLKQNDRVFSKNYLDIGEFIDKWEGIYLLFSH